MLRHTVGLAGALLAVGPAAVYAQGVRRPAPSQVWSMPARAPADTVHSGGSTSMVEGGAIFGGLMGVAFGIGWCSGDNQCSKGTSALIGGAIGAAIGASLGALFDSL